MSVFYILCWAFRTCCLFLFQLSNGPSLEEIRLTLLASRATTTALLSYRFIYKNSSLMLSHFCEIHDDLLRARFGFNRFEIHHVAQPSACAVSMRASLGCILIPS